MSSGFGTSVLLGDALVGWSTNCLKRFVSDEQRAGWMADRRAELFGRLAILGPRLDALIGDARAGGVALIPADLELPTVRLEDGLDLRDVDPRAFPLSIERRDRDRWDGTLQLAVGLAVPAAPEAIAGWVRRVDEMLETIDDSPVDAKPVDAEPVALGRVAERFGLYVGTSVELVPSLRDGAARRFAQLADELGPRLEAWVASGEAAEVLGGPLLRLEEVDAVAARGGDPRDLFNPFGPLVDGEESGNPLLRTSFRRGAVDVIVLIAQGAAYDWGKVNLGLRAWLEAALEDDHARAAAPLAPER